MKKIIKENAKTLRKTMTKEEKHLWYDYLKNSSFKWYRQRPIGNYIADFYCAKAKLIVEVDGSQHYDKEGMAKDEVRTSYFEDNGIMVVRFANVDVNRNFEAVCNRIDYVARERMER